MSSLNHCTFIGYMAADPESRAMPNGDTVANIRIGCGEKWKDKQTGDWKEKTEWVSCVAWRGLAEVINKYGRKGMQVFVSGKMTTRKWQDKQGNDRYTTEIQLNEFKMLGKKSDNEGQQTDRDERAPQQGGQQQSPPAGGFDDDIPF